MKVSEIKDYINTTLSYSIKERVHENQCEVLSGPLGDSLFMFDYGRSFKEERVTEAAAHLLNNHIVGFESYKDNGTWGHGYTGLFWAIKMLSKEGFIDNKFDFQYFDQEKRGIEIKLKEYDLVNGYLGLLNFYIEDPDTYHKDILRIIKKINDSAIWVEGNKCFWTESFNTGVPQISTGLLHGQGSVIYFLCKLTKLGFYEQIEKVIMGSKRFLISNFKNYSIIPSVLESNKGVILKKKQSNAISGWCTGMLSALIPLIYLGDICDKECLTVLNESLPKFYSNKVKKKLVSNNKIYFQLQDDNFIDFGLCHGLTGIIYVLNKIKTVLEGGDIDKNIDYWLQIFSENMHLDHQWLKDNFYYKGILSGSNAVGIMMTNLLERNSTPLIDRLLLMDFQNFNDK